MKTAVILILAAALWPSALLAQQTPPAPTLPKVPSPARPPAGQAPPPRQFAAGAGADNLFAIRAAEIALKYSKQTDIRAMAQKFLDEYRRAQRNLESAARRQGVAFKPALDQSQTASLEAMKNAKTVAFARVFRSAEMVAYQASMQRLSLYADRGAAGPLKAYAQQTYPTVHMNYLAVRTDSTH